MKGNQEILDNLNVLLAEELTAINQYILHGEMCDDWGYGVLHEVIEKRAIQEMKHAEKLIERILFLEGMPIVSKLNDIHIGSTVEKQLKNDSVAEQEAIKMYNDAVALATKLGDNGTKVLVESILTDEEAHLDWIEEQLDQIDQMGLENYLNHQI
ncbi:MAG: bacterioferritin [Chloroflexota bacterium]|nr:bacterioferritin [Chloroflexota bacterium]